MFKVFSCLKHIKQKLIGFDQCRVSARISLDDILEIEVYFPTLDFRVVHAFTSEELRSAVDQGMFADLFVNKVNGMVEAFKNSPL